MGTNRKRKPKKKGKRRRAAGPYPFAFRLKIVRLHLEDEYPAALVAQQFGISKYSVYKWCQRYRQFGEQGLNDEPRKTGGSKMAGAVTTKIVDLKKKTRVTGADASPIS
jgi:transposase-like protein